MIVMFTGISIPIITIPTAITDLNVICYLARGAGRADMAATAVFLDVMFDTL
jgi:hypothetical protein